MTRTNDLKRHWKAKHKMFDMGLTLTDDFKSKIGECSSKDKNLKLEILDNAKTYDEKISLGESIHKVLMETYMKEESLSRQHKEAFDLHQRQRLPINPHNTIKLYLWQSMHCSLSKNRVILKSFGLKVHMVTKGKPGFRTTHKAWLAMTE